MNDLAAECKVTKASLYYYFDSKSLLLYEIFHQACRAMEAATRVDPSWSPVHALDECTSRLMRTVTANPNGTAVCFRESRYIGDIFTAEQRTNVRRSEAVALQNICEIIGRGVESGDFRRCDTQVVAAGYLCTLLGVHRWLPASDFENAERFAAGISDLMIRSLSVQIGIARRHPRAMNAC